MAGKDSNPDFEGRTETIQTEVAWVGGCGSGSVLVGVPKDEQTGELETGKRVLSISSGEKTMTAVVDKGEIEDLLESVE